MELTHAQRVAIEDARHALAAEHANDLPEGMNPGSADEFWRVYLRMRLEHVAAAFAGVPAP